MALWLFKQEPDSYSYSQLEADGGTQWNGVSNPLALKHLRTCAAGDLALYYHTGKEKAVVGVMEITGPATPDPDEDDPKFVVVPVKPVRRLAHPVTLAAIKADEDFAAWELVTQSRLSVMPVREELWRKIERMASGEAITPKAAPPKKKAASKKKPATRKK